MKRVLVIGATGYLGRHVVTELKRRGHWVRVLSRHTNSFPDDPFAPDEIFIGEITRPETLDGLTDGVDFVFSSLGITRQRDKLGFWDVDYQGNKTVLEMAVAAGVNKFVTISVVRPELAQHLDIVGAREAFVDELRESGLAYAVVRATGFFSDMMEFLSMAKSGRVYLFGTGRNRMNPIYGADLARVCVDAFDRRDNEIEVGGPDVFSYNEIAELAFSTLNRKPNIVHFPNWVTSAVIGLFYPFNRKTYTILKFFSTLTQHDIVAPSVEGKHLIEAYQAERGEL